MAEYFASPSRDMVAAGSAMLARTFMSAPSVVERDMKWVHAVMGNDPRKVVTPLDTDEVEKTLCIYHLDKDWQHIVDGIWDSFDVGAKIPLLAMYLFRKPQIDRVGSGLHFSVYIKGAGGWPVLRCLFAGPAGVIDRPIQDIPTRAGTQGCDGLNISHDSGYVLSQGQYADSVSECRYRCRQFPDAMGNIPGHGRFSAFVASRVPGSSLRHFGGILNHASAARPTKLVLHSLARKGVCRCCSSIWYGVKCRSLWWHSGYASGNLQGGWFWANLQMDR